MNFVTIWIGDIKTNYVIHPCGTILKKYKGSNSRYNWTPFTKEMKCRVGSHGYKCIGLLVDVEQKFFLLHRLLGNAFIPNPHNKPTVDHIKNKEKLNNDLSNLRWATMTEQAANRSCTGGRKITKGGYTKRKNGYQYEWCEYKKKKSKYFSTLELVKNFQKEHLEKFNILNNII